MTVSEVTNELMVLEQTRSRLEAGLSEDENWRALKQFGASSADTDQSAARRARDARLEMALLANPLYRAWKHVNNAIDDLRRSETLEERPSDAHAPALSAADNGAGDSDLLAAEEPEPSADLPADISRYLWQGTAENGSPALAHQVASEDDAPPALDEEESEPAPGGEGDEEEPTVTLIEAFFSHEPAAEAAPAEAAVPTSLNGSDDVSAGGAEPEAEANGDPPYPLVGEPEEATVTFVLREPRAPLLPAASMPPDLGTERKTELFDRLRGLKGEDEGDKSSADFLPPDATAEEAEVVITTPQASKDLRQAEQRAGNLHRFRKALSGD